MKKLIFQGILIIGSFMGLWFLLSQINFMSLKPIQKISEINEQKIGELIWKSIEKTERIVDNDSVIMSIGKIKNRICAANGIDSSVVTLHIIEKSEVNAFAMPGNQLVLFSGLIAQCENPEQLAGVMSHELAHMQLDHVMKKLVKEVGLSVLISVTTNNSGRNIATDLARTLSSTSFDREFEREADKMAVEYLANAQIDPEHLANFFYMLSSDSDQLSDILQWASTHPELKERAVNIINLKKKIKFEPKPIMTPKQWGEIVDTVKGI